MMNIWISNFIQVIHLYIGIFVYLVSLYYSSYNFKTIVCDYQDLGSREKVGDK